MPSADFTYCHAEHPGSQQSGVFFIADSLPNEAHYDVFAEPLVKPDVHVPLQLAKCQTEPDLPVAQCEGDTLLPVSGWDIKRIFFLYEPIEDELHIGIECFGICGDADGDGDPSATSDALAAIGGQDTPDLSRGEGIAVAFDFDLNVADVLPSFVPDLNIPFDFVIGVPAGHPAGASAEPGATVTELECTRGVTEPNDMFSLQRCFGLYEYQETTDVNVARRLVDRRTVRAARTGRTAPPPLSIATLASQLSISLPQCQKYVALGYTCFTHPILPLLIVTGSLVLPSWTSVRHLFTKDGSKLKKLSAAWKDMWSRKKEEDGGEAVCRDLVDKVV